MTNDYFFFAIGGIEAGIYSGTLLLIGFRDFKYEKTALRSSSVIFLYSVHGIGGIIERPASAPMCLPERIILMKVSGVHAPIPVAESGVRFRGKDVPHGPNHVVK